MATKKAEKPAGRPKVKMITTIDSRPGAAQATVYFSDGTHALTKAGSDVAHSIGQPENVAPNTVRVWTERGQIVYVEAIKE